MYFRYRDAEAFKLESRDYGFKFTYPSSASLIAGAITSSKDTCKINQILR